MEKEKGKGRGKGRGGGGGKNMRRRGGWSGNTFAKRLSLHPQGKAHPADSFNRTQECFKSKTDYRENQNRIDGFRELGYPEKTILRNSEQLSL